MQNDFFQEYFITGLVLKLHFSDTRLSAGRSNFAYSMCRFS